MYAIDLPSVEERLDIETTDAICMLNQVILAGYSASRECCVTPLAFVANSMIQSRTPREYVRHALGRSMLILQDPYSSRPVRPKTCASMLSLSFYLFLMIEDAVGKENRRHEKNNGYP